MQDSVNLVVYSDNAEVRQTVIEGVGLRAAKDLPKIEWTEAATLAAVMELVDGTRPEVVVLDGEANKVGGMALARQIQMEAEHQPRFVILTARQQDEWLAAWAKASATVQAPYDPIDLQEKVAVALREAI